MNVPNSDSKKDAETQSAGSSKRKADDDLPDEEQLTPELVEDEAIRGDFMLRWAAILLAFLLGCTDIFETSTLVHVKSGQHTLSNFVPATTGIFSSSAEGQPWTNLSWLFDAVLALVYNLGETVGYGGVALSLFKALLAAGAVGVLVHTNLKDVPTWWGTICAVIALLACHRQFTARPELFTLLGVALTVRWVHRWKEEGDPSTIKRIVILFLLWANLDPRMFLGLSVLVLYALGETLGDWLGFPGLSDEKRRRKLWLAVGLCAAVTLINPFLWNALLAPVSFYSGGYRDWQLYHATLRGYEQIQYFSLLDDRIWTQERLTLSVGAGVLMLATALITFALNFRRLDFGHVFVLLGFTAFSMLAVHELATAAVVAAALAALNAQQWYQHTFRQTYSVETSELVFSRGGRGVTVVSLFVIAYLAATGVQLLGMRFARKTGVGLHPDLTSAIDGLRDELKDSYDDRPFNFVLSQGDLLVWIDKKPFIDSRMSLYTSGGDASLAKLHDKTRRAITNLEPNRAYGAEWKRTLNQHRITHVLPRLDSRLMRSPSTYYHVLSMLIDRGSDWQLCQFGPTTAVFYRRQLANESAAAEWVQPAKYRVWLNEHSFNFTKVAFREKWEMPETRATWPSTPTTLSRYLPQSQKRTPNPVEEARHYLGLLDLTRQIDRRVAPTQSRLALSLSAAYMAIRNANQGLNDDNVPHHVDAYRILGFAYNHLLNLEVMLATIGARQHPALLRALTSIQILRSRQALIAFGQALVIEPEDLAAWRGMAESYQLANQDELALRAYRKAIEIASRDGIPQNKAAKERYEADVAWRDKLEAKLELPLQMIEKMRAQLTTSEAERNRRMGLAFQALQLRVNPNAPPVSLAKTALEILEEDPDMIEGLPPAQVQWVKLLQLNGRIEESFTEAQRFKIESLRLPSQLVVDQRNIVAFTELSRGNYLKPESIWRQAAEELESTRLRIIFDSVPLTMHSPEQAFQEINEVTTGRNQGGIWLVGQVMTLSNSLQPYSNLVTSVAILHFRAAVINLEAGRRDEARQQFEQILKIAPDGPLSPLASFYMALITGKPVKRYNPNEKTVKKPAKREPVVAPRPSRR